jgi:two-component system chemotaxis response regulator CheY
MRHVWIIDDDEEMSGAVGLMLNLLDCDTSSFLSVRSAVQRLLSGKIPDLLFLDINLPEVSGFEMLEFLRRRPEWKNLPIVILSSEAADVVVDRALELGADSYVMKPVTIEELENAMAIAFSKHLNV